MNTIATFIDGQEKPQIHRHRVLLVDDDELVLGALECVLEQDHYEIVTCEDPKAALDLLKRESFSLVMSDYMMPQMNGGEFLKQAKIIQPGSMRILFTANTDVDAVIGAVKAGAVYKFILKPWNDEDLRLNVALALQQYDLVQKNQVLQREKQEQTKEIEELSKYSISNRSQLAFMLSKKGILNAEQMRELLHLQTQRKILRSN